MKLVLYLLLALPSFAAISANTVWEIQPTVGNDNNGNGFGVGIGTKTVTAATDLTMDANVATRALSTTHACVSGDANKYLNITAQSSGTAWTLGYYKVL